MLKIAVVGAGAIGGLIAGRLCHAGQPVSVVARGQNLLALQADGLTIEDAQSGECVHTRPRVCASAAQAGLQDVVIVAVKSYSLADVVLSVQPMLGGHTRLVTAVNGVPWWFTAGLAPGRWSLAELDPEGALARAVAPDHVIGCVVNCAASMPRPGWVRHATGKRLTLGPALGQPDATLAPLAQALSQAGFEAIVSDFIQQEVWKKLLGNITLNPIGALTLSDTRQMLDDPATAALVLTVMREVQALGHALGIDTGVSAEERLAMARKLGSFRSSMLQDLESHKPLELEGLFAAVLSLAAQTQTPLPATTMLHTLARLRASATGQLPGAVAS